MVNEVIHLFAASSSFIQKKFPLFQADIFPGAKQNEILSESFDVKNLIVDIFVFDSSSISVKSYSYSPLLSSTVK